jgi:hypothetical protein
MDAVDASTNPADSTLPDALAADGGDTGSSTEDATADALDALADNQAADQCAYGTLVPADLSCDRPCNAANAGDLCVPVAVFVPTAANGSLEDTLCICEASSEGGPSGWQCASDVPATASPPPGCPCAAPNAGTTCPIGTICDYYRPPNQTTNGCVCLAEAYYADGALYSHADGAPGPAVPEGGYVGGEWQCSTGASACRHWTPNVGAACSNAVVLGTSIGDCFFLVDQPHNRTNYEVHCFCESSQLLCWYVSLSGFGVGGIGRIAGTSCTGFARGIPMVGPAPNGPDAAGVSATENLICTCTGTTDPVWQCTSVACPATAPASGSPCSVANEVCDYRADGGPILTCNPSFGLLWY